MPPEPANDDQREFRCIHCHGKILVPRDLPPTTGPCPHCGKEITSPGPAPDPGFDPIFGKPIDDGTVGGPPPLPPGADSEDAQAERESMEKARHAAEEAERKAVEEAERKAAAEAERAEAERAEVEAAERKAREEEARRAAEEAERQAEEKRRAKEEAEKKSRDEEEQRAAQEAERQAEEERQTAELAAKEEAERTMREEQERRAAEEAERKAAEALERAAREEEERAAVAEEGRRAAEAAEREAREEAERREAERVSREKADQAAAEAEALKVEAERRQAEEDRRARELAEKREAQERQRKDEVSPPPSSGPSSEPSETTAEEVDEKRPSIAKGTDKAHANRRKGRSPMAAVLVLVVLLALAGGGYLVVNRMQGDAPAPPPVAGQGADAVLREKQYLEKGWEADAYETLSRFLAARRPAGKAAYSINGSALLARMEGFYEGAPIDDSDTPAEAFSVFPLSMKDRERGIFMLTYDQPPVFEIDEFFAPLAPLDVQYKLRQPDMLLATVARSSNFSAEPLKVHAIFKRMPDGLRLDWETFVQTKYRTLRDFLELPVAGRSEVFRVVISETVPEKRNVPAGHRTYLISDPAHRREDSVRVNVPVDSEVGRALSILNWRGTREGRAVSKTATLELRWTREEIPRLEVSRFLCWEFLGVGGEAVDRSE